MTLTLLTAWHDLILYGLTPFALVAPTSNLLIMASTLILTAESGERGKYVLYASNACW